jgi:hypothetical protein
MIITRSSLSLKTLQTNFPEDEDNQVDLQSQPEPWYTEHYKSLTSGLTEIDYQSTNSILPIFGEKAFPVATNSDGDVTIAAAEYGSVILILILKHIVPFLYKW